MDTLKKEKNLPSSKIPGDSEISRIFSILSYFVVLIVIGIPVWWYTTRVYRASLPLSDMFNTEVSNKTTKAYDIPLSLEYDILISLVQPDIQNLEIDFNGEDIEQHIQPFVNSVSSVVDFVVKSQWLYLTELGAYPRKIKDNFVILESQLPHIITPLETKLWTHLSPRPTLNLVIYFAHCSTPLYIYTDSHKPVPSNAFVSSRWGGFLLVNPDKDSCESKVFKPDLILISETFLNILQELLAMNGFDEENIANLKLRTTRDMIDSTRRTLKSLAQLLLEISSIVISDGVAEKINLAVENADKAEALLKTDIDSSLRYAKIAFKNSEEAFSDPSLLALLYFPDDQKYAIYIPLFLPVMIPVVMSVASLAKKFTKSSKVKLE